LLLQLLGGVQLLRVALHHLLPHPFGRARLLGLGRGGGRAGDLGTAAGECQQAQPWSDA
jgi:hypothetical protein